MAGDLGPRHHLGALHIGVTDRINGRHVFNGKLTAAPRGDEL
jgi:hypothetical protein